GLVRVWCCCCERRGGKRVWVRDWSSDVCSSDLEQIRAEQQLGESEARYRDLYDNAPNAYWVVGLDGRIQSANRRWSELIGYPLPEILGQLTYSFAAETPTGRPRSLEVRRKHERGVSVSGEG